MSPLPTPSASAYVEPCGSLTDSTNFSQFCLLDGLRYEKIPPGRLDISEVDQCRLFFNKKGKELLSLPRGGNSDANAQVYTELVVRMTA